MPGKISTAPVRQAYTAESNRDEAFWQRHQPLVSIVVACYSVRRYLPSFLDSIEKQHIDPADYELIFVIDGCPEDSGAVAREWMSSASFPVQILTKPNGGVASARNLGFGIARGRWITSPDPDDILDEGYFRSLEAAFEAFPGETMFATRLQRVRLDGTQLPHPFDFKFAGTGAHLVDLSREPEHIHLSGGTGVWSRELLRRTGLGFDERLRTGSDADFNLHYLIDNGARYVIVPDAVYWYISRGDGTSIIDRAASSYQRYEVTIAHSHPAILDHAGSGCPQWLANSLLYAVYHLFRGNLRPNSPVYDLPQSTRRRISQALRDNLGRIGAEAIRGFRVVTLPFEIRYAWLAAVSELRTSPVLVRQSDSVQQLRRIGFYSSAETAEFSVTSDGQAQPAWSLRTRSIEFLGEHWCYEHLVRVDCSPSEKLSLTSRDPRFAFEAEGLAQHAGSLHRRLGFTAPEPGALEPLQLPERFVQRQPATAGKATVTVQPGPRPEPAIPEDRPLWVVDFSGSDPRTAASLIECTGQTSTATVWSVFDAERLAALPEAPENSVVRGTPAHRRLMERAQLLITSDENWAAHNRFDGKTLRKTWIQVLIPDAVSPWPSYRAVKSAQFDAVVPGSPASWRALTDPRTPSELEATDVWPLPLPYQEGLQRLRDAAGGGTLLIAPASRRSWGGAELPDVREFVAATDVARSWAEVLRSTVLRDWCAAHGLTPQFLPPLSYPFLGELLDLPEWVELLPATDRSAAVARARITLTDYSGISFDAAYLGIPAVFYQFDRRSDERDALLTLPGVLDFEALEFGPVVEDADALIPALGTALSSGAGRAADLSALTRFDENSEPASERICQALRSLLRRSEAITPSGVAGEAARPPRVTFVVRPARTGDAERLARTLESVKHLRSSGFDVDALVPSDDGTALAGVEPFALNDPELFRLYPSGAGASGVTGGASLSLDWACVVTPGTVVTPASLTEFQSLTRRHPGLRVVAAPPAVLDAKAPDSQESRAPYSSVAELTTDPHAWIAAEHCLFARASDLPRDWISQDFFEFDFWYVVQEIAERTGDRFGILRHVTRSVDQPRFAESRDGRRFVQELMARLRLQHQSLEQASEANRSLFVYQLTRLLRRLSPELWDSAPEFDAFREEIARFIDDFDARELVASPWTEARSARYALCSAAGLRSPWAADETPGTGRIVFDGVPVGRLANLDVVIPRIGVGTRSVSIESVLHRFSMPNVELVLVSASPSGSGSGSGRTLHPVESRELREGVGRTFGKVPLAPGSYRRFEIPLEDEDAEWRLCILNTSTGELARAQRIFHVSRSPFTDSRPYLQYIREHGTVRVRPNGTVVVGRRRLSRLRYALATARRLRAEGVRLPERLRAKRRKDVILITDRPRFGDDNGEALFRYIQAERPDLRRDTWLVLDPSAPSYAELKKTRRLVHPGSRKHRELYLNARILCSSHMSEVYNNPFRNDPAACYLDLVDFTFVWLQHGITANAVGSVFNRVRRGLDGVVIATSHELQYAKSPSFGHTEDSILQTGFPRFDLLRNTARPESPVLLYMPTWRAWLTGKRQADGTSLPLDDFDRQPYFVHQRNLLKNPELLSALERTGTTLEMVLHPAMTAYAHMYRNLASERVKVHAPGTVSYRDMLSRGSGMITDYSSVFFDFAYLGKPVVFDHSDDADFRSRHYGHGIFDYSTSAPGPIGHSLDELVALASRLVENGFRPEREYHDRLDEVFLHRDRDNARRTIDRALEIDLHRRAGSSPA